MGKLDGKVAVITGGLTGMALAGAKLFVDEGAHVSSRAGGRKRWTRPAGCGLPSGVSAGPGS